MKVEDLEVLAMGGKTLDELRRDAAHWEAACRDAHDQAEKAEAKVTKLRSAFDKAMLSYLHGESERHIMRMLKAALEETK